MTEPGNGAGLLNRGRPQGCAGSNPAASANLLWLPSPIGRGAALKTRMCYSSPAMLCSRCNKDKKPEEFSLRSSKTGRRQSRCKSCHSAWHAVYYAGLSRKQKKRWLERTKDSNNRRAAAVRSFVWQYLLAHPCQCGESDPLVLEFDHVIGDKEFAISLAVARYKTSLRKIKQEIEKCVVRCANCHRRKTALDGGWWKDQLGPVAGTVDAVGSNPTAVKTVCEFESHPAHHEHVAQLR